MPVRRHPTRLAPDRVRIKKGPLPGAEDAADAAREPHVPRDTPDDTRHRLGDEQVLANQMTPRPVQRPVCHQPRRRGEMLDTGSSAQRPWRPGRGRLALRLSAPAGTDACASGRPAVCAIHGIPGQESWRRRRRTSAPEVVTTGTWEARWIFDALIEWRGTSKAGGKTTSHVEHEGYDPIMEGDTYSFGSDGSRGHAYGGEWEGNTFRLQFVGYSPPATYPEGAPSGVGWDDGAARPSPRRRRDHGPLSRSRSRQPSRRPRCARNRHGDWVL